MAQIPFAYIAGKSVSGRPISNSIQTQAGFLLDESGKHRTTNS